MARATVLRLGGLAAVAFVLAGAVNGTAATNQPDLSTPAAISSYLQSIGVDPATMTWQQGINNYAGPSCPGVGWTCTTSTNVVQIAQAGGQNVAECDGGCTVVQHGHSGDNHMKCQGRSSSPAASQDCSITQETDGSNFATVLMSINATGGTTQNATQTAEVTQTSHGGSNHSDVHQAVDQSLTFGATQNQDAYQEADVTQTVDGGGGNFSHVHQTQDQSASGGTTQAQNTSSPPSGGCSGSAPKPFQPHQCAVVDQTNNDGGTNGSQLDQAIGERECTSTATEQTQGTSTGGSKGSIDQTNPPGIGQNMIVSHQELAQRATGPSSTMQTQLTDPGCCGVSQNGAAKNHQSTHQLTRQSASNPDAEQLAGLSGTVHQTTGVSAAAPLAAAATTTANNTNGPNNTCEIDQHGRNNSGAGHFSYNASGADCAFVDMETVCQNNVPSPDAPTTPTSTACTSETTTSPPIPDLPALVALATTPTYGQDIPMPDYSTPPDYLADIGG